MDSRVVYRRIHSGLLAVALLLFLGGCTQKHDVQQPIAYSHKVHVAQEEIPCTECHLGAEDADHATIPTREICLECHDTEETLGDSPEEAKLVKLLASGQPLRWHRVHRLKETVHFSHRRHVKAGKILCERCHGDVPQQTTPFERPYINFSSELIGMERCIACHKQSGNPRASVDCLLCHR